MPGLGRGETLRLRGENAMLSAVESLVEVVEIVEIVEIGGILGSREPGTDMEGE